jgi:hypothetical protein
LAAEHSDEELDDRELEGSVMITRRMNSLLFRCFSAAEIVPEKYVKALISRA